MREVRLGDIIDDFCVKCKRIMNHSVVSILDAQPAKVRCRTCHSDHDYRHEQAPPPKVDPRKAALFNEVLGKIDPSAVVEEEDAAEPIEEAPETPETPEPPEPPAPVQVAKGKGKPKAKAKAKRT